MSINFDYENKIIVITGATGGIGKVIAEKFATCKGTLILSDRKENHDSLMTLMAELKDEYNIDVFSFEADMTQYEQIAEMDVFLEKNGLEPDILVNNAGINKIIPAHLITEREWDDVVDTNLKGNFFMSRVVALNMINSRKGGAIINIASQHGVVGNLDRAPYCASKAGVINLARELALEWAKYNIRVNCVSPTFVIHSGNEEVLNGQQMVRKLLPTIPLGRYATAEDVANAVLFLASPLAGLITGHNLIIDGGYTAR